VTTQIADRIPDGLLADAVLRRVDAILRLIAV
jgi:hypothetical protein